MSTEVAATQIDPGRVRELTEREAKRLEDSTQESKRMFERAHEVMPLGVPSSYHARDPWPIYLERGEGARVWDVDGHERWDFHNGFGSMVMGHAHPAIVEAISERARLGTHFAAPTEDGIVVAEELARRFGLPKWRFTNSGSEATMDAIRIARGLKGRDTVMKIFGSYHGHHDGVMVAVGVSAVAINSVGGWSEIDPDDIPSFPYGGGVPKAVAELTVAVPFNDADALERRLHRLEQEDRKPACLIMEAAMMNLGVVLPEPGYLEAVREITRAHDVVLIFDEVKTGLAIAAGGATERFGVQPDMVTLAKTLGAGLPSGAIGATDEVMEAVESETVFQVGTFNGNPLTMAAARAGLLEVLTPEAYEHLDKINDRLVAGCQDVVDRYRLPAYTVGISSKGCVIFSETKITDYESFMTRQNVEVTELAWLYNLNRGIFATPGREEEWTVSVTHTEEAADAYVAVFEELARDLTGSD
jgi:glutamate-1-semialdehyde 2,1-aminomutase